MKVLLLGNGGREDAVAKAISKSRRSPELYSVMVRKSRNPDIDELSEDCLLVESFKEESNQDILDYAVRNGIEIAFIGPEEPLEAGIVDFLWEAGIPVVGPRKLAAQIETDKAWARDLMKKYGISGCPEYRIFRKEECGTDEYIDALKEVAIKPKGLTGGKGVGITGIDFDIGGAKDYARKILENSDLVIEERLIGEEFTVQAFVDGETLAFAPAVQDHKRAEEGDKGKNTGGMGSYSDSKNRLSFMTEKNYSDAKKIMRDVVSAIKKETGVPYKGILYGQFMATAGGIRVVEFNARFGDPEAMNVIPLLKNDFLDVCTAITKGTLKKEKVSFEKKATVCKYAVPSGYPENPMKDSVIEIGDVGEALLFYGNVYRKEDKIYTTGSRAVAVVGIGDTIDEAEKKAEAGISAIQGNVYHRRDIGTRALINKRITHMKHVLIYGG